MSWIVWISLHSIFKHVNVWIGWPDNLATRRTHTEIVAHSMQSCKVYINQVVLRCRKCDEERNAKKNKTKQQTITFKYFQMSEISMFFKAETTCAIVLPLQFFVFAYSDQSGWRFFWAQTFSFWLLKTNRCAASFASISKKIFNWKKKIYFFKKNKLQKYNALMCHSDYFSWIEKINI